MNRSKSKKSKHGLSIGDWIKLKDRNSESFPSKIDITQSPIFQDNSLINYMHEVEEEKKEQNLNEFNEVIKNMDSTAREELQNFIREDGIHALKQKVELPEFTSKKDKLLSNSLECIKYKGVKVFPLAEKIQYKTGEKKNFEEGIQRNMWLLFAKKTGKGWTIEQIWKKCRPKKEEFPGVKRARELLIETRKNLCKKISSLGVNSKKVGAWFFKTKGREAEMWGLIKK